MTKLDYKLSPKDIEVLKSMVKDRKPQVAIIELEKSEMKANIVHTYDYAKAGAPIHDHCDTHEIADGKSTFDCLKEILCELSSRYHNYPCVVVMNHITTDKHSGSVRDDIVAMKWSPDDCTDRTAKMIYSSAWGAVKDVLSTAINVSINNMLEFNDWDDVSDKLAPKK